MLWLGGALASVAVAAIIVLVADALRRPEASAAAKHDRTHAVVPIDAPVELLADGPAAVPSLEAVVIDALPDLDATSPRTEIEMPDDQRADRRPSRTPIAVDRVPSRAPARPHEHVVAAPPPPAQPPPADGCDEVSCVLDRYGRPCCQRYKPSAATEDRAHRIGDDLDRSMVKTGIEHVKPRIIQCGEQVAVKGIVKLSVKVGSDGRVIEASVASAPDPKLGTCVASAMRNAIFAQTKNGGTFTYPFAF